MHASTLLACSALHMLMMVSCDAHHNRRATCCSLDQTLESKFMLFLNRPHIHAKQLQPLGS
jgi:hypothetical protein